MRYLSILIFVYLSLTCIAQELSVDWGECFGASNLGSISHSINTLSDSKIVTSVLVEGENEAFTNYHGDSDAWVLILDENGSLEQEKCFGGSAFDQFFDIKVLDESIYFVGLTQSTDGDVQSEPIGGLFNIWVVKTDIDLNIIWERQYGSMGTNRPVTAKITSEGGLLILVEFFNAGGGDVSNYYGGSDIWIYEIDSNGELIWEKTFGNEGNESAENLIVKDNGNIVVLGTITTVGGMIQCDYHGGVTDIWIFELDRETKEILWQNSYGGSKSDIALYVLEENSGYFIVGGTESSDGDINSNFYGEIDAWAFQIDFNGSLVWEQCFGGSDDDSFWNIYKTVTEGYLIFGGTKSEDGYVNNDHCPYAICYANTWVVELDSDKNIIWNNVYGPIGYDSFFEKNSIKRIGERDFIIANFIHETDNHSGDVDCEPYPINNFKSTWIYRLYDQDVGIQEYNFSFNLKSYPIPAKVQLTFELPVFNNESSIYLKNIFGKTIAELPIIIGQKEVVWNCKGIAKGVYFYFTEIDGINYSGKVLIL
jgi:hypothetical protein